MYPNVASGRLAGVLRTNPIESHHLIVVMLDYVAVPGELALRREFIRARVISAGYAMTTTVSFQPIFPKLDLGKIDNDVRSFPMEKHGFTTLLSDERRQRCCK